MVKARLRDKLRTLAAVSVTLAAMLDREMQAEDEDREAEIEQMMKAEDESWDREALDAEAEMCWRQMLEDMDEMWERQQMANAEAEQMAFEEVLKKAQAEAEQQTARLVPVAKRRLLQHHHCTAKHRRLRE